MLRNFLIRVEFGGCLAWICSMLQLLAAILTRWRKRRPYSSRRYRGFRKSCHHTSVVISSNSKQQLVISFETRFSFRTSWPSTKYLKYIFRLTMRPEISTFCAGVLKKSCCSDVRLTCEVIHCLNFWILLMYSSASSGRTSSRKGSSSSSSSFFFLFCGWWMVRVPLFRPPFSFIRH